MRAIYLNHTQYVPTRLSGWLMLGAGLAALVMMLMLLQQASSTNAVLNSRLNVRSMAAPRSIAAMPDAKLAAAKAAIAHIVTPWAALLKALEAAHADNVKMLALQPNAKTRTVSLSMIALNQASMWAYLESLKQQPALREVHLLSNESIELNGAPALAFQVEAKWQI